MAREKTQGSSLLMEELKRQLRLSGTLRSLAPTFGLEEGQLYNKTSQEAEMSMSLLCQLPSKVALSPSALLRKGLLDTFEDPLSILLSQREKAELPVNPFLDGLKPRFLTILEAKVDRQSSVPSQQPVIESLEEMRYHDRAAAGPACEKLILEMVDKLEEIPGKKPRKMLGELAAALALWATIQRSRGFRDLSVKAFTLAFPLVFSSGDAGARGSCYQRAAYLLGDLDRPDLGYEFIRDAVLYFSAEGTSSNLWKSHRVRGHFLAENGKLREAQEAFELALEHLPGSEWRDRVGALQGLGVVARRMGQAIKARGFLDSAVAECKRVDIILGHVQWSRGLVESDLGNWTASRVHFEQGTSLLGKFGSAGDVALICVDHVEVLLRQKDTSRAVVIVSQVAEWLPQLRANPILRRAFSQFLDLARTARIELARLPKLREDLRAAWKRGESPSA